MKKSSKKIYLSKGQYEGRHVWHYVVVDTLKQPLFKQAAKSGSVDVADFGEVIASGWGEKPPQSVVEEIQKKYGSY